MKPNSGLDWVDFFMPRLRPSEQFKKQSGSRLWALREALKLTQKEAALAAGVGNTTWANYEAGTRQIDPAALTRFINIYGGTTEWIYRGSAMGLPAELQSLILSHTAQQNQ